MQLDSMPTSSTTFTFSANKITGGITPWKPTSTDPIGAGHFQFSIADGMIGKIALIILLLLANINQIVF